MSRNRLCLLDQVPLFLSSQIASVNFLFYSLLLYTCMDWVGFDINGNTWVDEFSILFTQDTTVCTVFVSFAKIIFSTLFFFLVVGSRKKIHYVLLLYSLLTKQGGTGSLIKYGAPQSGQIILNSTRIWNFFLKPIA